jgi:hypothetical protein
VAFSADGQVLASADANGAVKLWDARTGQELRTLQEKNTPAQSVAFSADGQVLASAYANGTVKLRHARSGQELHTLRGHAQVHGVAFSADGQVLASASGDSVTLWDVRTGRELRTLRGHTGGQFMGGVTSVAFAADGQILASASGDNTVKLWDARSGQELRTLRGHTASVESVAFAADGQVLASAGDGTVKLWDVRTGLDPDKERRFRLWVTAPDLHLHRELAEQADKDKQPFALAFRLGRYLAGKHRYAAETNEAASLASWLGTASERLSLLAGLPVHVKTPLHAPSFPDGIACTGVLYKDSGIAPARLRIGTARALDGDPSSWLNHALHGGALYRNGEHAKALTALGRAVELHGKASPLTQNLLGLTYLALGQKEQAMDALKQALPAKSAAWEDVYLQRLLQPEIDAALAKGR